MLPSRWCWIATWMLLAGVSLARAADAPDAPPFDEHTATYTVFRNGEPIGSLDSELSQREDGLWHYRIDGEATAFLVRMLGISTTEAAWFAWADGAIVPLTYHHVAERPGRDRFWQHRYDWTGLHTDTTTHKGETRVPLAAGAVDPLTLRLAASATIAENSTRTNAESSNDGGTHADLDYLVVEREELETQHYRFLRRESITVASRCFDTAVYERYRREGSSRNYIAWHAPVLGGLPVRTQHVDDGDVLVIELSEWSPESALPARGPCTAGVNTG